MEQNERLVNLEKSLERIKEKKSKIMFYSPSVPQASGGIAVVYQHVKTLVELGYDAFIIYDENPETPNVKYIKPDWLGEEYTSLKHIKLNDKDKPLSVSPDDIIIIPEGCTPFMEQIKNMPSLNIILCQSYLYILGALMPGMSWNDFGIKDVIVVTPTLQTYIEKVFGKGRFDFELIRPSIDDNLFKPSSKPKQPIVAISSRDQQNTLNIIKHFYVSYPQFRWVTFKDMHGMTREQFADSLEECCLGVWVDQVAGFGTFPIECAKTGTPFIGLVPNIIPEFAADNKGGIWIHNVLDIPEVIANYVTRFVEDKEPQEVFDGMKELAKQYTKEEEYDAIEKVYGNYLESRKQAIIATIDKLKGEEVENLEPVETK